MIVNSPFEQSKPAVYIFNSNDASFVLAKINPVMNTKNAMSKFETIFKKYNPAQPFFYTFVDEDYAKKFSDEKRISKLITFLPF